MSVTEAQLAAWSARPDEELCALVRQGALGAEEVLVKRYVRLVRKLARPFYLAGGDSDDLIQEGMIGLFKAIRDFRDDRASTFFHFAELCIARQLYSAVEASNRKKHAPLNTYVSFYSRMGEEGKSLAETLPTDSMDNPEQLVIAQENLAQFWEELKGRLSPMEREVLDAYLSGQNYRQIADEMGKSPKAIDNALSRIKAKIK